MATHGHNPMISDTGIESPQGSLLPAGSAAIDSLHEKPEDVVNSIKEALKAGTFLLARQRSVEGAERYPNHAGLQKYARILAPPKVIQSNGPAHPSIRLNRNWLKVHQQEYRGRWIALRDGTLIGVATSFDELAEQVGKTEGILLTKIP